MVKIVNSDDNGHIFCCLMVLKMLGYRRGGGMAGETVAEHRIAMALLGLLNVKAFDRISITEITEKAAVSRVSYYRHFSSKEDILLRHSSYILDGIVDDLKSGKLCSGSEFWQRLFTELSDTNLMINMSKAGLEDEFFSIFESRMEIVFTEILGIDVTVKMNLVFMEFVIGGLIALLNKSMLSNRKITVDDVASFLRIVGEQSVLFSR